MKKRDFRLDVSRMIERLCRKEKEQKKINYDLRNSGWEGAYAAGAAYILSNVIDDLNRLLDYYKVGRRSKGKDRRDKIER